MKAKPPLSIFMFAGEQSGDLHGSHLAKEIKRRLPEAVFEGVGGPLMVSAGISPFLGMHEFEVMGFTDVLLALPRLVKKFYKVRSRILTTSPNAVILVDYPGFNLRLARSLREQGYAGKIIQYISPTVWAWGKHRIKAMEETLDLLMAIYPFESACFNGTKLKVEYVGNPLKEYIKNHNYDETWRQRAGIPDEGNLVALFPGSRLGEIKRNLPLLLDASLRLKRKHPAAIFALSCAHPAVPFLLKESLRAFNAGGHEQQGFFPIPKQYTYELMRDCSCAMAKSGTVTLELAWHQRPTVVVYKLTAINRLYAKYFLKLNLPYYSIVNILAGRQVFPELIETGLTPDRLFQEISILYEQGSHRSRCIEGCADVIQMLGILDASARAADAVLEVLA